MGADKSAENTPNAPKFICPNFLPKPKILNFCEKKASLGVRSPCLMQWKQRRQAKASKKFHISLQNCEINPI
jgi:hypothetical protein